MLSTALDTLAPYIFSGIEPDADNLSDVRSATVRTSDLAVQSDALTVRIRAGDTSAFAELVQRYHNALVRFAASILSVPDDAEDLVQELLAHVWEHRDRLDPHRALHTYVFTSVRNRALNWRRNEQVQRRHVDGYAVDEVMPIIASPDQELDAHIADTDQALQIRTLAQALKTLPERRRTAMLLRFERGMTHKEIGLVLGLSEKAAQQVVLRTIADLRALLRPLMG